MSLYITTTICRASTMALNHRDENASISCFRRCRKGVLRKRHRHVAKLIVFDNILRKALQIIPLRLMFSIFCATANEFDVS